MTEADARKLEVKTRWDDGKKRNVCVHCGEEPKTFYVVTGHDHTDSEIDYCSCRQSVVTTDLPEEEYRITAEMSRLEQLLASVPEEAYEKYGWVRDMCAEGNRVLKAMKQPVATICHEAPNRIEWATDYNMYPEGAALLVLP